MSKKIVVKLELHSGKDKQKAMKAVSTLVGIDALSVDMATRKMTVVGMVDPVDVVSKLRKAWSASIDSVGPAKEPEKEGEKKEGEKKDGDGKKDDADGKKEGEGDKKDGDGKDEAKKDNGETKPPQPTEQQLMAELMNQYRSAYSAYHDPYMNNHYVVQSMEENPNSGHEQWKHHHTVASVLPARKETVRLLSQLLLSNGGNIFGPPSIFSLKLPPFSM